MPLSCPGKDFPEENINTASQIAFFLATCFKDWRRKSILRKVTWRQSQDSKPHLLAHPIPPVLPHSPKGQHRESQRQRSQAKSESPAPFPGAARASKALSAPKRGSGSATPVRTEALGPEGGSGKLPLLGLLTFQRQSATGARHPLLRVLNSPPA